MTVVSADPYKGQTFCVSFDNGKKIYLHADIITRFNITKGVSITNEELLGIIRAAMLRKARERALYLIDYREHSYLELLEKLQKNYDDDICFEVLDELASKGIINDRRYAEHLAEKYFVLKKYGEYRVKAELNKRGIPQNIISDTLDMYEDETYDRLTELVQKKYSPLPIDDYKSIQKVKASLARLGYSFDDINNVINDLLYDE